MVLTLLFADDKIIIKKSEQHLQEVDEFNMKLSLTMIKITELYQLHRLAIQQEIIELGLFSWFSSGLRGKQATTVYIQILSTSQLHLVSFSSAMHDFANGTAWFNERSNTPLQSYSKMKQNSDLCQGLNSDRRGQQLTRRVMASVLLLFYKPWKSRPDGSKEGTSHCVTQQCSCAHTWS